MADDTETTEPKPARKKKAGGDFFAVDRKSWHRACELGMNPAVAFLVLARFSQRDNRTTKASVDAVERHTGISRGRAREARDKLVDAGLAKRSGSRTRPVYTLATDSARELTEAQEAVIAKVKADEPLNGTEKRSAAALARLGVLKLDGAVFTLGRRDDWIWLPNTLVTGAGNEVAPVELMRQTRDVLCLRLLVDLYHGQNLRDDGGVSRKHVYVKHDRVKVGEQGPYVVWGFRQASTWVWQSELTKCHWDTTLPEKQQAQPFFTRFNLLRQLGLVHVVPYVFEGSDLDAEPVFPVGFTPDAGELEHELGKAAYRAGKALLTDRQDEWATIDHGLWLVPLPAHMADAQLIGLARLHYRPHTRQTKAWFAELNSQASKWRNRFAELAGEAMQHQGGIKVQGIKEGST